jgi:serine/threonine protein phosphatase PrpC
VYLLRAGVLEQLSVDDTVAGSNLTAVRGVLTSAAGSREDADVHLKECPLEDGDVMLLATDGLHGIVPDDRIQEILTAAESVNAGAAVLLAAAREAGAPDNVSVVVFQVAQVS